MCRKRSQRFTASSFTPKCASSEIPHEPAQRECGPRRAGSPKDFGKTAVLLGGDSSEREISLLSGNAVLEALKRRGVDAHAFDPKDRPIQALERGIRAGLDRAAWPGGRGRRHARRARMAGRALHGQRRARLRADHGQTQNQARRRRGRYCRARLRGAVEPRRFGRRARAHRSAADGEARIARLERRHYQGHIRRGHCRGPSTMLTPSTPLCSRSASLPATNSP